MPELRWALGALRAARAAAPAADVGRGVEGLRRLRAGAGKLRPAEGAPASVAATGLALQVLPRLPGNRLHCSHALTGRILPCLLMQRWGLG